LPVTRWLVGCSPLLNEFSLFFLDFQPLHVLRLLASCSLLARDQFYLFFLNAIFFLSPMCTAALESARTGLYWPPSLARAIHSRRICWKVDLGFLSFAGFIFSQVPSAHVVAIPRSALLKALEQRVFFFFRAIFMRLYSSFDTSCVS